MASEKLTRERVKQCAGCGAEFRNKPLGQRFCSKACFYPNRRSRPAHERFWKYVQKTEGCWIWVGGRDHHGYGKIRDATAPAGYIKAHRLSWELANGAITSGLCVCHRCDNPQCVRPDHLFLGTVQDNMRDAKTKGRMARGEAHYSAKLTADDVIEIRRLMAAGESSRSVARRFGVSANTPRDVLKKSWRHLA